MSNGLGIPVEVEFDAVMIVRRCTVVVSSADSCSDRRSVISPLACQADRGTVRSVGSTAWAHVGDRQRIVIRIRML